MRWGDTLNSISYRTGVSVWAIAQANGIYNLNCIYAGTSVVDSVSVIGDWKSETGSWSAALPYAAGLFFFVLN